MRIAALVLIVGLAGGTAWAQQESFVGPPAVDVLGAHDNAGRGCASCHVPHNGAPGGEGAGMSWLWGSAVDPEYGHTIEFRSEASLMNVAAAALATGEAEVTGIIVCVSCHDGNVTPQNMMASRTYEQRIGLQPFLRDARPPTMLGNELEAMFKIDHPLGQGTNIPLGNGLEFVNGQFTVEPNSSYARFVRNYGWPSLAPAQRSNPYGVDREGRPYVVCTTCHNQHAMSVYASRPGDPIEGDDTGRLYTTFFFVNGPYNPNANPKVSYSPSSSMQFCRQCHFDLSNEGHNTDAPTVFD